MKHAALLVLVVLAGGGPRAAIAPGGSTATPERTATATPEGTATKRPDDGPPLAILVDRWLSSREAPRI